MGKTVNPDSSSLQKFGVPFYGAAWLPHHLFGSKLPPSNAQDDDDQDSANKESASPQYYVVLAGGGGEGRSGIHNAVLLVHFDLASNSLSTEPAAKLELGSQLPYRIVVHPQSKRLICALQESCRLLEWEELDDNESHKVSIRESEEVLNGLEGVGQQLALAFNNDGTVLATGGDDGKLRIFRWHNMEMICEYPNAHPRFKDLCFSPDGKFLVSLGNANGKVWNVTTSAVAATLSKENDEAFSCCRFSPVGEVLFIAAVTGKGGCIVTWNTSSWERIRSKHVAREPISAFDVSPDGKWLAIGTTEGEVLLISSTSMKVQTVVKKAHLGMVTKLAFSHDSRALVSASMDSSARVTVVKDEDHKSGGFNLWIIVLFILVAILVYFLKSQRHLLNSLNIPV